jgi:hypothetical protein
MGKMSLVAAALSLAGVMADLHAKTPPPAPRFHFEVASIRPSNAVSQSNRLGTTPDGGFRDEPVARSGALAECAGEVAREFGDAARGLARQIFHRGRHVGLPSARVRGEVVARGGLAVVVDPELRHLLDHRGDRNRDVLDRLADRLGERGRDLIHADRRRPGQRVRPARVRSGIAEDCRDRRRDVAHVDHRQLRVAEREVERALIGDLLGAHQEVLREGVRLHDRVRQARRRELGIRERVQAAVDRGRVVGRADRGHPHDVLHATLTSAPQSVRHLRGREHARRREQPRDIDTVERRLDGAQLHEVAGAQLDTLRGERLRLARGWVAYEPDQAMPRALKLADDIGRHGTGCTGEEDRRHVLTVALYRQAKLHAAIFVERVASPRPAKRPATEISSSSSSQ